MGPLPGRVSNVTGCDHDVVPVSLVLTSDTHVPQRSRDLPHSLWSAIDAADVVVHAGDWVDVALLDEYERRAHTLVAVCGNNDHGALRERLPEVARAEIEGVRMAVVHETGDKKGREERCAARFPDVDVLVFGHSHIPWDTTAATGLRLINPGSPTDRRRQPHGTFVTAVADDGQLRDVTFHPVPRRR
jgi:putative phosphoesterase